MMKIDKKRLERQQVGVDRWFISSSHGATRDKVGTFHYCTGVGKTFTAILVIKRLFRNDPLHNVIVCVPTDALVFQWQIELNEHFTKKDLNRITVMSASYVVNSQIYAQTDTLIVDELHLFLGEEYIKVINGKYLKSNNRLGLTATYYDPKGRHTLYEELFPIIDVIDESEAIERGFVAPFIEYNLAINFTIEEQDVYEKSSKIIRTHMAKFGNGGLDLATKCLSGGKFKGKEYTNIGFCHAWARKKGWHPQLDLSKPDNVLINDLWNPQKIMGYAKLLMKAIRIRKDLLYNATNKTLITVDIIKKFKGEKIIVFGQKTNYADKVNLLVNQEFPGLAAAYHSNIPTQMLPSPKTGKLIKFGKKRLKKKAIEDLKSGRIKVICTASSLDTGFNVKDILIGIIGSGTQNFNQQKQRGGRIKRVADVMDEGKVKLIVNLYIPDTKDEDWLRRRQSKSTNPIHWIESIDEIVFNPAPVNEFSNNVI